MLSQTSFISKHKLCDAIDIHAHEAPIIIYHIKTLIQVAAKKLSILYTGNIAIKEARSML